MNPVSIATLNVESLGDHDCNPGDLDGTNNENNPEQDNLFNGEKLKETLQPLYISLRCFGLVYERAFPSPDARLNSVKHGSENSNDIEAQRNETTRKHAKLKQICNIGKCYCIFIGVTLWIQVVLYSRNLFTAETFLDVMQMSGTFGWMVLCACQHLIFVRANFTQSKEKLSKFGKFIKEFVLVKGHNITDTKRQIKGIVLVTWVNVLIGIITMYVALFQTDVTGENEARKIVIGKWSKDRMDTMTYLYLPVHTVFCGVWLFSTANYVALNVLLAKRFDDVFQRTSSAISLKKNINFASLRREHVQLCRVLSALEDILSSSGLVSYAIYIPMVCILLNVCIATYDVLSWTERVTYIFWIVANVTILSITSISGALVNHKVYSLSEVIYEINANDLDRKSELELMLLISSLNSNSAGLTVGGLTTITKGMILTVFGTVIGYFTILIQFK